MEHFHALGHRKIAFIGGSAKPRFLAQRYRGLRKCARGFLEWISAKSGLSFAESVELHGPEIGYEGTSGLMEMPERPTAIFADNDMTALGVLKAFTRKESRCLRKSRLIGFDNIEVFRSYSSTANDYAYS